MKFEDFLREHFVLNCWESPRSQGNRGSREQMSVSGHRAPGGGKEKAAPGSDKERGGRVGFQTYTLAIKKKSFPINGRRPGLGDGRLIKVCLLCSRHCPGHQRHSGETAHSSCFMAS